MSDASQHAMDLLNAQWYNALVAALGASQSSFQICQSGTMVPNTTPHLWPFFDNIPPYSLVNYEPQGVNRVSGNYPNMVANLRQQVSVDERSILGDYYDEWKEFLAENYAIYKNENNTMLQATLDCFDAFAIQAGLDQSVVAKEKVALGQLDADPVVHAVNLLSYSDQKYAYNRTIDDLTAELNKSGRKVTLSLDSRTASSDTSHAWAAGKTSGWKILFYSEGTVSLESFTVDTLSEGVSIDVSLEKVLTFQCQPLSAESKSHFLKDYKPWYWPGALSLGYKNKSSKVWREGQHPTWEELFGPDGSFQRMATAVVVADGISVTLKSRSRISQQVHESYKAAVKKGFWPFYKGSAVGGWTHDTSFTDVGQVTVTCKSPEEHPEVIGVVAQPMDHIFKED